MTQATDCCSSIRDFFNARYPAVKTQDDGLDSDGLLTQLIPITSHQMSRGDDFSESTKPQGDVVLKPEKLTVSFPESDAISSSVAIEHFETLGLETKTQLWWSKDDYQAFRAHTLLLRLNPYADALNEGELRGLHGDIDAVDFHRTTTVLALQEKLLRAFNFPKPGTFSFQKIQEALAKAAVTAATDSIEPARLRAQ